MKKCILLFAIILIMAPAVVYCQDAQEVDPRSTLGRRVSLSLNRLLPKTLGCYNNSTKEDASLKTEVNIKTKITVSPGGEKAMVVFVFESVKSDALSKCIRGAIEEVSWPANEEPYYFFYKFSFAPKDKGK